MVIVHPDGSVEWEKGNNREIQVGLQAIFYLHKRSKYTHGRSCFIPVPCSLVMVHALLGTLAAPFGSPHVQDSNLAGMCRVIHCGADNYVKLKTWYHK